MYRNWVDPYDETLNEAHSKWVESIAQQRQVEVGEKLLSFMEATLLLPEPATESEVQPTPTETKSTP